MSRSGAGVHDIETDFERNCAGVTLCTAEASTLEFDFTSSRGNGSFEVDTTNFVIPTSGGTSFNVIAADIKITDAGWLFGQLDYGINNVLSASCSPAECSLQLGTQVVVPNFGTYHPTCTEFREDMGAVDHCRSTNNPNGVYFRNLFKQLERHRNRSRTVRAAPPSPNPRRGRCCFSASRALASWLIVGRKRWR